MSVIHPFPFGDVYSKMPHPIAPLPLYLLWLPAHSLRSLGCVTVYVCVTWHIWFLLMAQHFVGWIWAAFSPKSISTVILSLGLIPCRMMTFQPNKLPCDVCVSVSLPLTSIILVGIKNHQKQCFVRTVRSAGPFNSGSAFMVELKRLFAPNLRSPWRWRLQTHHIYGSRYHIDGVGCTKNWVSIRKVTILNSKYARNQCQKVTLTNSKQEFFRWKFRML